MQSVIIHAELYCVDLQQSVTYCTCYRSRIMYTGLDLQSMAGELMSGGVSDADVGRKAFHIRNIVSKFQDSFTALEKVISP